MGMLDNLFGLRRRGDDGGVAEERAAQPSSLTDPLQWLVDFFGGAETNSGRAVDEDSALVMSTVYACVTLIAETVASLPLRLYRRMSDGGRAVESGPLDTMINVRPNSEMTAFDWRSAAMGHLLLWGNSYSLIERDRLGRPIALWPIVPDRVTLRRARGRGALVYQVATASGVTRDYGLDDILHVKAFGYNGLAGQSVISFAREAIGLGLAAEEYGARFFGSGANPGLIMEHPSQLSPEAAKNLRESLERQHSGLGKTHKVLIIEEGMKASRISVPPGDSQFIELRGFQREEICQLFKVPPHMIGLVSKSTSWGSGIEQQQIGFVVNTLRPWLVRWEQALNASLVPAHDEGELFFEHKVDGLLRGDIKARYLAYRTGRQWGWLSVNDIRRLENMGPVQGGDQYLSPMNMVPLEDAGKSCDDGEPPGQPSGTDAGGEENEQKSLPEKHGGCGCGREHRTLPGPETRGLRDEDVPAAGLLERGAANASALGEAFSSAVRAETDGLRMALEGLASPSSADVRRIVGEFYEALPPLVRRKLQSALFRFQDDVSVEAQRMIGKGSGGKALRSALEKFKREYLDALAQRYSGDGLKQMETIIRSTSANDLLTAMRARLDTWDMTRANRYADEELIRAGNAMARETWSRQGVTKLRWIARGAKVCPFCRQLSGKIVGIDEPFLKNGEVLYATDGKNWMAMNGRKMHPPIHRGCVCVIVPEGHDIEINHYAVAKMGGKHAGYLENLHKTDVKKKQIEKAIRSKEELIEEHLDKIKNPRKYISAWDNLDHRHRDDLVNRKWPKDIERLRALLGIDREVLRRMQ